MLSPSQRLGLVKAGLAFASVEVVLSLLALFIASRYTSFTRFRNLKIRASHPLHLIAMKTLCNLIVAISRGSLHAWALFDEDHRFSQDSGACVWSNMVQDLFNHASSAWFFILSVDLFIASRNPFSVPTGHYRIYHLFVWLGSALALAIVRITVSHQSALTSLCYLDDQDSRKLSTASLLRMFPLMFVVALLASVYILIRVKRIFNRVALHPDRQRSLRRGLWCVVAYGAIGLLRLAVNGSIYLTVQGNPNELWSVSLDSVLLALEYVANLGIVLLTIRSATSPAQLKRSVSIAQEHQPLLQADNRTPLAYEETVTDAVVTGGINRDLRDDIMLSSLFGIMASLNRKSQLTSKVCRSRVMLPPSYGRELDFVDYERQHFVNLRQLFAISDEDYARSLWGPKGREQIQHMSQYFATGGRSGSFFYLTHDQRFIVKTVTATERDLLRRLLPDYYLHLQDNPNSLLSRLCGLYAMRLSPEQRFITILVQLNVAMPSPQHDRPHVAFDLKGSTVNRSLVGKGEDLPCPSRLAERLPREGSYYQQYKDNDLEGNIIIGSVPKAALSSVLTVDAAFLNTHGLMDYSLLMVVHLCRAECRAQHQPDNTLRASQQLRHGLAMQWQQVPGTVRFGVIDWLQEYTWGKHLEYLYKTWGGVVRADVSSVGPDLYAERFLSQIQRKFV
eukprot:m.68064 g.68064  ORF g.68064 m.68064 type:complete len:676 (-) comp14093_c0_seq1:22-2049(-)